MKKLLSCVAFVAMSLGFTVSASADTLIASGGYGVTYFPSTCKWNFSQPIATPNGLYTTGSLVCSGATVAYTDFYNNNQGPGKVRASNGYYAVRKSGAPDPIGYDWAVYQKQVMSCSTPWSSGYIYTSASSVSYARAMTMQFNPNQCSAVNNCTLDIAANVNGYALVCK